MSRRENGSSRKKSWLSFEAKNVNVNSTSNSKLGVYEFNEPEPEPLPLDKYNSKKMKDNSEIDETENKLIYDEYIECCVPFCDSSTQPFEVSQFNFHPFPVRKHLRGLWQLRFQIDEVSDAMKACSRHFKDEDYSCMKPGMAGAKLKEFVAPTLNLPKHKRDSMLAPTNLKMKGEKTAELKVPTEPLTPNNSRTPCASLGSAEERLKNFAKQSLLNPRPDPTYQRLLKYRLRSNMRDKGPMKRFTLPDNECSGMSGCEMPFLKLLMPKIKPDLTHEDKLAPGLKNAMRNKTNKEKAPTEQFTPTYCASTSARAGMSGLKEFGIEFVKLPETEPDLPDEDKFPPKLKNLMRRKTNEKKAPTEQFTPANCPSTSASAGMSVLKEFETPFVKLPETESDLPDEDKFSPRLKNVMRRKTNKEKASTEQFTPTNCASTSASAGMSGLEEFEVPFVKLPKTEPDLPDEDKFPPWLKNVMRRKTDEEMAPTEQFTPINCASTNASAGMAGSKIKEPEKSSLPNIRLKRNPSRTKLNTMRDKTDDEKITEDDCERITNVIADEKSMILWKNDVPPQKVIFKCKKRRNQFMEDTGDGDVQVVEGKESLSKVVPQKIIFKSKPPPQHRMVMHGNAYEIAGRVVTDGDRLTVTLPILDEKVPKEVFPDPLFELPSKKIIRILRTRCNEKVPVENLSETPCRKIDPVQLSSETCEETLSVNRPSKIISKEIFPPNAKRGIIVPLKLPSQSTSGVIVPIKLPSQSTSGVIVPIKLHSQSTSREVVAPTITDKDSSSLKRKSEEILLDSKKRPTLMVYKDETCEMVEFEEGTPKESKSHPPGQIVINGMTYQVLTKQHFETSKVVPTLKTNSKTMCEEIVPEKQLSEEGEEVILDEHLSEEGEEVILDEHLSEEGEEVVLDEHLSEEVEEVILDEYLSEEGEEVILDEYLSEETTSEELLSETDEEVSSKKILCLEYIMMQRISSESAIPNDEVKTIIDDNKTQLRSLDEPILLATDYEVELMTGLYSLRQLNNLDEQVKRFEKDTEEFLLNTRSRVILTLLKIKLNLSFWYIGYLFNVTSKMAEDYFYHMIEIVCKVLTPLIYWPKKRNIKHNIPTYFGKYQRAHMIFYCFEIPLQTSECFTCCVKTFSLNKKRTTMKFLFAVTPSGMISYVSKGYGGQASDGEVFKQTQLLSRLKPFEDTVMVINNTSIQKECANNCIKCINVPAIAVNENLSEVRNCVEKSLERLKIFKILDNPVISSMAPFLNQMMVICAAVLNLHPPIVSIDRFHV